MTTMGRLADQALAELYGYSRTVDVTTYLSAPMSATDLTLTVAAATNFSRGLVQIGDELLMVDAVDRSTNVLTLGTVQGRGVRGTAAAAHAVGDTVTMAPAIPRSDAVRAVGEVLRSSSGLFAVGSVEVTANPSVLGYAIPAEADAVLSVSWWPPVGESWVPVRHWRFDPHDSRVVLSGPPPGVQVRIMYTRTPSVPAQDQDFSETGLPASCEDVIRLGAAYKLASFLDPSAQMAMSAEADRMNRNQYPTTGIKVAQFLYQLFRQRLDEEVRELHQRYPIRAHYGV